MSNPSYFFSTILKTLSVLLFLAMSQSIYAQQTIVEYEYWFNDDFNNRTITAITPVSQYHLDTMISVSTLPNGINVINFRAKDSQGKYSVITSQLFYKKELTDSDTNHLLSYEYWFDDDFQNKTVVDISPAEQTTVLAQLDVSTMSNGMHLFNFRAKDERGYYSSIAYQFFFKKTVTSSDTNYIVSYKYWYDDDYNNLIYVDLPTPTKQLNLIDNLDMTRIPKGIHTINFQFKDDANFWSVISTDTIEKISLPIADYTYEVLLSNCDSTVIAFTDNSIDGDMYLWDFADGTTDTLANPTHTFYNSGIHSVILTITDTTTLADSTKQMDILITGHTANSFAVMNCDSYTSPSGNYTYTTSGVYYDTIPNHWGCDSLLTINLTINYSDNITDVITACDSYTWIDGNTYTASNNTATFTLTNAAGCDSIVSLDLTINYTPDNTITQMGDTLISNADGVNYQWLDCNNDFSPIFGENNQNFTPTETGNYAVEVTNYECIDTSDCINVIIDNILENTFAGKIKIYPNPSDGSFYIDLENYYDKISISLANVIGEIVYQNNYYNTRLILINIENAKGIYFISISSADEIATFKIILN
ncbi:MAG: T9SS type A sorting domain-containing protein [Bacteroidales bacterium]|jgi:adenylate kinase family enzyme|nr:PKD domain-containing protein [Bacteroidales bacterium]MDI9576415.1 PKD domain-containing protein [Bacteroidota bacterium]HHW59647.1 T9SS type A sorting domain-containing protein [Bacteroidales bacterium]HOB76945.1 PKD domain-containing protein [Bacteroidales bacterium]HPZ60724.1 PKD domain-containing protein [Bacteroidales bacterium]